MSKQAIAALCRSFARRITMNGEIALATGGDPALLEAFKILGWDDPHPLAKAHITGADIASAIERATVQAPERAVKE